MPGAVRALEELVGPPERVRRCRGSATSTAGRAARRRGSPTDRAWGCAVPSCTARWRRPRATRGSSWWTGRRGEVRQDGPGSGPVASGPLPRGRRRPALAASARAARALHAPAPRPARYGLRRHFAVAPWTDLVEVTWARRSEAYVTPVGAGPGRRRRPHLRSAARSRSTCGRSRRLRHACQGAAGDARARGRSAAAAHARPGGRAGAAGRRCRRLRGRADRRGHRGVGWPSARVLVECLLRTGRRTTNGRGGRCRAATGAHRVAAAGPGPPLLGPAVVPAAARCPWVFGKVVDRLAG